MSQPKEPVARFEVLDSLRGVAALGVAAFHLEGTFILHARTGRGCTGCTPGLYLAVDFFLVLSGFVLSHSHTFSERQASPLQFLGRRMARIWPLHVFTVCINMLASYLIASRSGKAYSRDRQDLAMELALLQNVGLPYPNANEDYNNLPNWTICNEFWVNVAFAFLVHRSTPPLLLLPPVLAVYAAIYASVGHLDIWHENLCGFMNYGMLRCGSAFLLGSLAYRLHLRLRGDDGGRADLLVRRESKQACSGFACNGAPPEAARGLVAGLEPLEGAGGAPGAPACTAAELSLSVAVFTLVFRRRGLHTSADFAAPWLFAATVLVFAHGGGWLSGALAWLRPLGTVSYSVYLNHWTACLCLAPVLNAWSGPAAGGLLLFWAVLVPYSALTYLLVEQPGQQLLLGWRALAPGQDRGAKYATVQAVESARMCGAAR